MRPQRVGRDGTFETFIRITADGAVTAYNGHVDLGTGIRTALGQIVAEELDVSFARVVVVLGDTARRAEPGRDDRQRDHPDHGRAAAQGGGAGAALPVARAAERLELPADDLTIEDGLIRGTDNRSVSYGELIGGETIRLELADDVAGQSRSATTASSANRCRASTCRPRRPAS